MAMGIENQRFYLIWLVNSPLDMSEAILFGYSLATVVGGDWPAR